MAFDVKWLLSADDKATPVFEALRSNATQATDGVTKALSTVGTGVNGVIGAWGSLAAVVAGGAAFKAIVSETISWTGESVKLSKALGVNTEQASILNVALGDVYLSHEDMLAANSRLTRTLTNNEAAFKSLGVATRDQNGNYRSSLDIMLDVNAQLLRTKEGVDRNVAGTQIYGRGWQEISGILKLTPGVMEEARLKAEQLHLIVGPEGVEKMKKYKAMMNDLQDVQKSLVVQIGNELLPVLTRIGVELGQIGVNEAPVVAQWLEFLSHPIDFTVKQFRIGAQSSAWDEFDKLVAGRSNKEHMSQGDHAKENAERAKATDEANKKYVSELEKRLAAYKTNLDKQLSLEKQKSEMSLATAKDEYDRGEITTREYYERQKQLSLELAQVKINNLNKVLLEEESTLAKIKRRVGKDAEEYKSEQDKKKSLLADLKAAELEYQSVSLNGSYKLTEAVHKENDSFVERKAKLLELAGDYVGAEEVKQEAYRQSAEYLRMEREALSGNQLALAAMAAAWRQEATDMVTAQQKETTALQDHEKAIKGVDDEIQKLLGTYQEETAEAKLLREEKEKLEPLEKRLTEAKANGSKTAVDRLNEEIAANKKLYDLKKSQMDIEQRINAFKQSLKDAASVLSGEVVGWNGNTPIKANNSGAFVNGVDASDDKSGGIGLYTPPGISSSGGAIANDPFFRTNYSTGIVFTDANGKALPSFDVGTPYVQRDMIAKIHKGERIITASDNAKGNYGGVSISGGIQITVQGGNSSSEILDQVARKLAPKLDELYRRRRAA